MPEETTIDSSTTQPEGDTADTTNAAETTDNGLPGDDTAEGVDSDTTDAGLPGDEADADSEGDAENELKGAPEEYAEWDISEGEDIKYTISDEQKEVFTKFGKDNNLDDKQMQGIVSFDIARQKELAAASTAANEKFATEYKDDGVKASRKEHGEKYKGMLNKNKNTYETFFDEDTRKTFNDMGISSQPGFFNALNKITALISEDTIVPGDAGQQQTEYNTYTELNPQTNVKNSQQ